MQHAGAAVARLSGAGATPSPRPALAGPPCRPWSTQQGRAEWMAAPAGRQGRAAGVAVAAAGKRSGTGKRKSGGGGKKKAAAVE